MASISTIVCELGKSNSTDNNGLEGVKVDFGLQAGIFTNDLELAFELADSMDCGGVMINDSSDYRIDAMPFGGVKGSGVGREGVMNAVKEMTDIKTYCFNLRK